MNGYSNARYLKPIGAGPLLRQRNGMRLVLTSGHHVR